MKKILAVIVCLFCLAIENAFSAQVAWMYVQHRDYEDGRSLNRLSFGLTDENGQYLRNDDSVTDVKLYDPNGKTVNLPPHNFDSDEEMYGSYDGKNSQWHYGDDWRFGSWFSANFSVSLIPGIYRLKVTTDAGQVAERTFEFSKIVKLPIFSSNSIQLHPDSFANVIWTWTIPEDLGRLAFNHKTRARATIDIYKNQQIVAWVSITVPSHMGYVFIPHDVVQKIISKGDRFGLRIQLETRDNGSRTYSKPLFINDLRATVR